MITKVTSLFLLIVFLGLTACETAPVTPEQPGAKVGESVAGKSGGTLIYRLSAPPSTFNFLAAKDEPSLLAAYFLMSARVLELDHRTQQYTMQLAESVTPGADGQTVEMKLRNGLKFSDGKPLTADDVLFSLKAMYDEKTASPVFRSAMLVGDKEIAATKLDDLRIQFKFPEKVASYENYLENLAILPKHLLEADLAAGKLGESWKIDADINSIATSGAFTPESSTPGQRLTLKRNPHYFKKDANGVALPYLEKVVLEVIPDSNNAFTSLTQGSLDLFDRIRGTDYAAITAQPGSVKAIDGGPGGGVDHVWFNLNPKTAAGKVLEKTPKHTWFSNRKFREAVSSAIDRKTIAEITMKGLATPIWGFVSPINKTWINPDIVKTPYDLARAKTLLAEAGFKLNEGSGQPELMDADGNRVEFSLIYPQENEQRKLMAGVLQEDLAKVGIKMQVVPVENQKVIEQFTSTKDYDAILFGLSVSGIQPNGYASFLLSSAPTHQWHPNQKTPATEWEAKIDKLFAEQSAETDPKKRAVLFNEIQTIISTELPVIPISARHVVSAANNRVGNFAPSSIFPYSLWNADQIFIR